MFRQFGARALRASSNTAAVVRPTLSLRPSTVPCQLQARTMSFSQTRALFAPLRKLDASLFQYNFAYVTFVLLGGIFVATAAERSLDGIWNSINKNKLFENAVVGVFPPYGSEEDEDEDEDDE